MARIAGIDLPKNKRGEIGLTYIYGIGRKTAQNILTEAKVDWNTNLSYTNREGTNQRKYFGPVKLTKFKVRLINNKGYDVDLNGRDWSFKLKVTQHYQY